MIFLNLIGQEQKVIRNFLMKSQGLDLAAKPMSKTNHLFTAARKRLSRKSPGPELRKTLRSIPPPTNVVGPETVSRFSLHNHTILNKKN